MDEHRFPVVLGKDFAGTLEGTGPGADGLTVRDRVLGVIMKPELGDGCFGELVATAATEEQITLVRAFGSDEVVDHRATFPKG